MDGQTPLHVAVKTNNIELVKSLSEKGTFFYAKDLQGKTPLHWAVLKGCTKMVRILVNHGANPDVLDSEENSPFHYALNKDFDLFEILVQHVSKVNLQNSEGQTPLHIVASNLRWGEFRQFKATEILLEKGAWVNVRDNKGETPLQIFFKNMFYPDRDLCTLLLKREDNIFRQDRDGRTLLHQAVGRRSKSTALMLKSISDKTVVNYSDDRGDYPLHTAVINEDLDMVELLLDNGAFIDRQNRKGETPLHLDLMNNRNWEGLLIFNLLIQRGAQVNVKNKHMETPLHIVFKLGFQRGFPSEKITYSLLAKGAIPNSKDLNNMTPLHYAVMNNLYESVKILLQNGAQSNGQNENWDSLLLIANCNTSCLELLLESGADVNFQDNYGRTVLHHTALNYRKSGLSVYRQMSDVNRRVDILLDWGASLSVKDHSGKKPFDYYEFKDAKTSNDAKKAYLKMFLSTKRKSYPRIGFCKEVEKMKELRFGNNTLFDVFRQYNDPKFLWNTELESAVQSQCLRDKIPTYAALLKSTYKKAKERFELFEAVVDIIQTPLPIEVLRYILTFVDNDSLSNVVKAKKAPF